MGAKNMKSTKSIFTILILLLVISIAGAEKDDFEAAREVINSKIVCDNLDENQLESLGDYYMEQIHPGEAHEYMGNMMGGEGSESLKQVHINMARSFYCGDQYAMSPMMMNSIMGRPNGMMGNYRMMGYPGYYGLWGVTSFLFYVAIMALIVWVIIYLSKNKRRNK